MTEEPHHEAADESTRTGAPAVDAVLDSIASLDQRPLEEHVQVFEAAHDDLRRALDATPDQA